MKTFRFPAFCRLQSVLPALLALAPLAASAQTLTNNGATLTVQPGTLFAVNGDMLTQASGTLANAGTVQLTGDFTLAAAGTASGTGLLRFGGTADQSLNAPANTALAKLEMANTGPAGNNRLLVPANLTVTDALTLTNGMVRTPATATITLLDGAGLSGEATGRYVQGNLRINRNAVSSLVDFGNGLVLDATGQNLGEVAVTRTAGLQTAGTSFATNPAQPGQKSIDCIWTVAPRNLLTAPVAVTLTWLPDNDNGLASFSQAQLWQQANGGSPWAPVGATGNAPTRSLSRSLTALNRLTISSNSSPLPVELMAFSVERQGPNGQLRWNTASEKNNAFFTVESSIDGHRFARLGQVAGHGTTAQPRAYEWTDPNLARYAAEMVYYRLRQVDQDGTESFSPVRSVPVPVSAALVAEAFPSPLHLGETLSLRLRTSEAGPTRLLVTDALGRTVLQQALTLEKGTTTVPLPAASTWPQGVYLLRVQQAGQQQTLKVVRD
jgi:hypothetical protein